MSVKEKTVVLKGGEFLIKESGASDVFTPEEYNDDQKMIASMANEFLEKRIWPNVIKLDKHEPGLMEALLTEAGQLGLLGMAVPEEYGGMEADFITEALVTEVLGAGHSFSVAFGAHTGIGTLPILYFGTPEQRAKYLPKLASGELKAAYCLTEPYAGSDAVGSSRSKATLNGDHYILEGSKMWITNAGFADVFTVFAKIDGDKFTGFIVDAKSENIRLGAEEDKMGIKGSSTRQVFFEGVKVPVENVLGVIGQGHKIAFNVLNIGRIKLGIAVCGGAKIAVNKAIEYANERIQFQVPISTFGAIRHKLAEQAIRVFVLESTNTRIANLLEDKKQALIKEGTDPINAKLLAAEEYAIECAIAKVLGSETLDYVVDETVQIYGGNGFSEEYTAARAYRDSRINRIFEGTNEINRLLSFDMLIRRAMAGKLDLMTHAMAVQKELMSIPDFGAEEDTSVFAEEKKALRNAKKATLAVAGAAVQKLMQKIEREQEVIMNISDMAIETFALESAILRVEKMVGIRGEEASSVYIDIVKTYCSDAIERINLYGKHAVCGFAEGDELNAILLGIKRFTKYPPFNTIAARRRIAKKLIADNRYSL